MTTNTKARKPAAKAAKLTKAQADVISLSKAASANGDKHIVKAADGRSITIPTQRWSGKLRTLSQVGGSFAAFEAEWDRVSAAVLAKGVDSRSAPNAAKSVQDAKAKERAKAAPAKPAPAKGTAKAAKPAPAKGTARTYKVTGNLSGVREGTWRHFMLSTIFAHTDTKAAQEACDKARGEFKGRTLDFNWVARSGYIAFA